MAGEKDFMERQEGTKIGGWPDQPGPGERQPRRAERAGALETKNNCCSLILGPRTSLCKMRTLVPISEGGSVD